jgi:hypothetical protein
MWDIVGYNQGYRVTCIRLVVSGMLMPKLLTVQRNAQEVVQRKGKSELEKRETK